MINLLSKRPSSSKADNFSAVRLLAAIIVVYGHSFPLAGVPSLGLLGNSIQAISVKIFFVISGYLVTESWLRDQDARRYFLKRILRILPALIIVVFFSAVIIGRS